MSVQEAVWVPVCIVDNILGELEEAYDEVTRRAYEIFLERGGICTMDLEDWLKAERELLFKPQMHVEESNRLVKVTIRIGEASLPDLQLLVTPDAMVIRTGHSTAIRKVFRTIEFPRRIDVRKAEARYADGCLVVTASCMGAKNPCIAGR